MPVPKPSTKPVPKRETLTSQMVMQAANGVQAIKPQWLALLLKVLPWVILFSVLVVLFPGNPTGAAGPQLFGTGLIAVCIVFFAFQNLLDLVPETLEALWHRELVSFSSGKTNGRKQTGSSQSRQDMEAYLAYLGEFEDLLNNRRGQWGMVIAFELLTNLWLGFLNWNVLRLLISGDISPLGYMELGINITLAALIAPMAWRLVIIGLQIWRLPLRFELRVQFEHPDRCGGLEPVGNLCLWNILIISLPLVYLGGWLLIARSDTSGFSFYDTALWQSVLTQAGLYADAFTKLLWVLVPFTIIGFLLPLWNTHLVMSRKRREVLIRLDGHIKGITNEWDTTLQKIGDLTVAEGNEKLGQLEFAQQIYERQKKVPVWPINLNILIKFASTQIVPLLGITNLGPGIIRILSLFADFVSATA